MKDVYFIVLIVNVEAVIKEHSGLVVDAKRIETQKSKKKLYILSIVMVGQHPVSQPVFPNNVIIVNIV